MVMCIREHPGSFPWTPPICTSYQSCPHPALCKVDGTHTVAARHAAVYERSPVVQCASDHVD